MLARNVEKSPSSLSRLLLQKDHSWSVQIEFAIIISYVLQKEELDTDFNDANINIAARCCYTEVKRYLIYNVAWRDKDISCYNKKEKKAMWRCGDAEE